MASFVGAEADGSGAVGIRDSSGAWKELFELDTVPFSGSRVVAERCQ